jgi:integral membrane protein
MNSLLKSKVGRLRLIGMLEGSSLLFLIFIAVPMKYYWNNPLGSEIVGPIHGVLFLLFILYAFVVGHEQKWKFWSTTWKVLLASVVPFGTFYIDKTILRKIGD